MMQNAYTRFYDATTVAREDGEWKWSEPTTPGCSCCQRAWANVEEPDKAVAYRYATSMATEWICSTCYTPRLGSYGFLGIERMAGKSGKTVPAKLGMLPGTGAVITASDELYLAVPPKNFEKYKGGWLGQRDRLFIGQPLDLLFRLQDSGQLGDISEGIIYIGDLGRKSNVLMDNLTATTDLAELWVNNGTAGLYSINLATLNDVVTVAREHGIEDKIGSPTFWRPITQAAKGKHNPDALAKWADNTPGAAELVAHLPDDPHDRAEIYKLLQPLLQGDKP